MQNQESTHSNTNNEERKLAYNSTINTLLNRRSIRAFKNEPISEEIVNTLELVAQRAACSQFLND